MEEETIRRSMRNVAGDARISSDVRQLAHQILQWRLKARPAASGVANSPPTRLASLQRGSKE
jgi:hypothetical protein